MPNYEGGSVEIQIKSTADKARASLEALSGVVKQIKGDFQHLVPVFASVNKLANGLRTIEKLNMSKVSTQIDTVGEALGRMSTSLARTDLSGFNTQSEQAAFALNRLTNSFRQLDKLQQIDTRRVYQDLNRLGRISSGGIDKLATALKTVDLTSIKASSASINTLVNGLQKIQGLKLDTNITGNLKSQLDALAPTLTSFLQQLQGINIEGLQRLASALKALPKAMESMQALDMTKIGQVFSTLAIAIQPFLTRLREASAELQAFATIAKTFGGANISKGLDVATSSASRFGSVFSTIGGKVKQTVTSIIGNIKRLGNESNKTNNSLSSMFSIGRIYFFLNYTKRAVQAFGSMLQSTIDFVEIENLFSRSMGNMRAEAIRFQNTISETFGLALPDLMKSQALFNNIVKQLGGINEEVSYGISETLTKMALDFSALYNVGIDKAMDTFQAAMTGQVKPVRRIAGMDITQQTLQTYLDEAGINRTVRGLTQVEKRLLTVYSLQRQMAESRAIGAYADEIENAANQLKILSEQIKEVGRWLSSVFMGTIGRVLPYLNGFVMALKEIVKTLALLVGYKIPETIDLNDALGLEDAQDGLGGVADGIEKVKQASTGIDELNIISPAQAADASDMGGIVDPAILGLLTEYDNLMDGIRMKAIDIRNAILEWLGFAIELNEMGGIDLVPPTFDEAYFYDLGYRLAELVNEGLAKIPWDRIKETAETIATNLAAFLNGAIAGLDWTLVGATIGEAINTALLFVHTWLTTFDFFAWGTAIATGLNGAINTIDWVLLGAYFAAKFMSILNMAYGFVTTFDWVNLGVSVGTSINSLFDNINWGLLGQTLSDGIKGILSTLRTTLETIQWDQIGEDIKTFLINIDWVGIFAEVFAVIATAMSGFDQLLVSAFGQPIAKAIEIGISVGVAKKISAIIKPIVATILGSKILFAFQALAGGAATFGEALAYAFPFLAKIGGALLTVGKAIGAAVTAIAAFVGLPVWAVGAIAAAIAAAVALIINYWDEIVLFFTETIPNWWTNSVVPFFTEFIPALINNIGKWFAELPGRIFDAIVSVKDKITSWGASVAKWFSDELPKIITKVTDWFAKLPGKIGYELGFIIGSLVKWAIDTADWIAKEVPKLISAIVNWFIELPGKIYNAIIAIKDKIAEWGLAVTGWFAEKISKIISSVVTWFVELPGKIYNAIAAVKNKIVEWGTNVITWFTEELPKIINNIIDWFAKLPEALVDIGSNMIKGLWNGIVSAGMWLWDKLKSFFGGLWDFVSEFFSGVGSGFTAAFTATPRFATGGFPEDGLFFANSNELIGSVAGRTAVANNDMIVSAVSQGVAQAVASVLTAQRPQQDNRPIVVSIDGREVVRAVRNGENDMGVNPIGGAFANA